MQRRRSLQTRAKVSFLNTFHNNVFQERNFFLNAFLRKRARTPRRGNGLLARKAENGKLEICQQEKEQKNYRTYENQFIERNNQLVWLPLFNEYSRSTVQNLFTFLEKAISFYPIHCLCFVTQLDSQESKRTTVNRQK